MKTVLTLLVDCAGVFDGDRIAAANSPVRKFLAALPADLPIRIVRYSDTAMWHVGPDPVPAGEVEWIDLPSGGYLSSLAHAVNLAGQSFASAPEVRNVVLLISDGALSDPEEIVQAVLAKRFDSAVLRAAVPLSADADAAVLRLFAGDAVFDSSVLLDPRPFLAFFGDTAAVLPATVMPVTLCCSVSLGDGDSFSLSVSGTDLPAVKEEMRSCLAEFGSGDALVREKIREYVRRVL